jgi:hypothetical protein
MLAEVYRWTGGQVRPAESNLECKQLHLHTLLPDLAATYSFLQHLAHETV